MAIERNYWVAKHDMASFHRHPGWIWRSVRNKKDRRPLTSKPYNLENVKKGDYWFAFAYEDTEEGKKVSIIAGLYKVTQKVKYIPNADADTEPPNAWVIESEPISGFRESCSVLSPPIWPYLMKNRPFNQFTVWKINEPLDFKEIQKYVKRYDRPELCDNIFRREPQSESEVLAVFISKAKELGVVNVEWLSIQPFQRFPDALVYLESDSHPVSIEFEFKKSNFWEHKHDKKLKKLRKEEKRLCVIYWFAEPDDRRTIKGVHFLCLRDMLIDKSKLSYP